MKSEIVKIKRKITADPKNGILLFAALLFLAVTAFIISLQYFIDRNQKEITSAELQDGDLSLKLTMDKRVYGAGEKVRLRLVLENTGSQPVVLRFPTNVEYDFLVQRVANYLIARVPQYVWKYSASTVEEAYSHTITLKPGQARVFSATWNQQTYSGEPASPGRYIVTGYLNTAGRRHVLTLLGRMKR
jgi:hypothetical protein